MDFNYYNIIPAEEHIETAFPSKRGLYPHEILVLNFAPKYNTESEKFPQYWLYRYGIKNVSAILEDLYKKGFLKYADIGVTIGKHNAEELKSILKEHGLKVTGKKSVLVSRILENVSVSEIESIFTERYYDITDIGEKEIEENGYVMEIHNNSLLRMSIWDANIILHHNPDSSFDEIIEKQQQKELEKAIKSNQYVDYSIGLAGEISYYLSHQLYDKAIWKIAHKAYLEINAANSTQNKVFYEYNLGYMFPYPSHYVLHSDTITMIANIKHELNIDNDELSTKGIWRPILTDWELWR